MTTLSYAGKTAAQWLGDLRRSGSFEESDLEELGNHLEDEMGQLAEGGLSEKEALWVAMSRVGNRNDLPAEYAKTNTRAVWRHRFWWMAAGILGYLGVNYLLLYISYWGTVLAASAGIQGVPQLVISLLLMAAVTGAAILLVWRLLHRTGESRTGSRFQRARRSRKRTALLYLLCVGAAVLLAGLGLFGWIWLPSTGPEVTLDYLDEARIIFTMLLAVALVSAAFLVTRPARVPAATADRRALPDAPGRMKTFLWATAGAACVMAPLAVAAALFVPSLLHTGPEIPEGHALMTPAHWWQADMTGEQMETLSNLWGKPINAAELMEAVWPGVLQQMPEEAKSVYEHQGVNWSPEGLEGLAVGPSSMCAGTGVRHDDGQRIYFYYVGSREWEQDTLVMNSDRGFAEDRLYRVSLYTDQSQP